MATTGIWKITKRLDHVLDYVMNAKKTTKEEDYSEFHKFSDYNNLDFNTEESCYISGLNCVPEQAHKDMMFTKEIYEKKTGILGYHAFQSFKEGEVTPELAHKIGVKLAEEIWGDRFEVIVATHINTNHIHNHFVINSVSFKDGKKYHDCNETYALIREVSDSLCSEFGLSVLDNEKIKKGKVDYTNYYKNYVRNSNYHTIALEDLNRAIGMAYSYKDFENIMRKMGYEINNRYGKLSIKREPYKKNIRIERAFGSEYSLKRIEERILNTKAVRVPFLDAHSSYKRIRTYEKTKKQKSKGLYGLYKYYCYILKVYPKHYPNKMLSPYLRLEVKKMDEISEQTKMLVKNKIKTYEQFTFHKQLVNEKVNELVGFKHNLWIKHKRAKTEDLKEQIRLNIESINIELLSIKKEVKLCDGIEERIDKIKENIKKFEQDKEKEMMKDEF